MKLLELEQYLLEALSYFEAFRRLGFRSDDIYLAIGGREAPVIVQIVLQAQGKSFSCNVAVVPKSRDEVQAAWKMAAEIWNTAAEEERKMVWRKSHVLRNSVDFLAALISKGFSIRQALN
jgi:hypothetical protein